MTRQPPTSANVRRGLVALALFVLALLFAFAAPGERTRASQLEPAPGEEATDAAIDDEVVRIPAEAMPEDASADSETAAIAQEEESAETLTLKQRIDNGAGYVVSELIEPVLFFGIPTGLTVANENAEPGEDAREPVKIPLILLVLVLGGVIFTFLFGFVNIRLFSHSIAVIRGKFDRPEDEGEISHFQALTSALSATVGLGNISGVALAISAGGAGAVFWMWVIAFFGMSLKFSSCSFAQLYRRVKPDGTILGGPMVYLEEGISERFPHLAWLGKTFSIVFAVFTMFAAFGGGNMFQGNQSFSVLRDVLKDRAVNLPFNMTYEHLAWGFGILLAVLVGLVILGGIRRIGEVTSKLVPGMCVFYCLCCLTILAIDFRNIPHMFVDIFQSAFSLRAGLGGLLGVMLIGATRAAFSNEAGLGSAAIAHAAAKTEEPIREGVVAMIGPFIDTIVVCTMTALTILVSEAHLNQEQALEGIAITSRAFDDLGTWAPVLLCVAAFVFAYSTIISWSYYGEKATEYLVGTRGIMPYRVIYVLVAIFGPIISLTTVVDFSNMLLLSMAFPNIIGMLILYPILRPRVKDYIARLRSGEMKPVK